MTATRRSRSRPDALARRNDEGRSRVGPAFIVVGCELLLLVGGEVILAQQDLLDAGERVAPVAELLEVDLVRGASGAPGVAVGGVFE